MADFVQEHINEYNKTITDCYCVCHSDYSSCSYCPHCKGNNDVNLTVTLYWPGQGTYKYDFDNLDEDGNPTVVWLTKE